MTRLDTEDQAELGRRADTTPGTRANDLRCSHSPLLDRGPAAARPSNPPLLAFASPRQDDPQPGPRRVRPADPRTTPSPSGTSPRAKPEMAEQPTSTRAG